MEVVHLRNKEDTILVSRANHHARYETDTPCSSSREQTYKHIRSSTACIPRLTMHAAYPPPPQTSPGFPPQNYGQHYPPPPPGGPMGHTPPPPQGQQAITHHPAPSSGFPPHQQQQQQQQQPPNNHQQQSPQHQPPKSNSEKPGIPPSNPSQSTEAQMMAPHSSMPGGAPPQGQFQGVTAIQDDVGTFNGGSFRISHRDTNSVLTLQLAMGCPIQAKPGKALIRLWHSQRAHTLEEPANSSLCLIHKAS